MRVQTLLFPLVTILLFAGACNSKPSLVGEWTGTLTLQGANIDMDFQFERDGTMAVKQTVKGQGATQRGTYKEEDKSFSMKSTSIESPDVPKDTLDKMNAQLAASAKTVTFDLEWKDPDTIAITQQGAKPPLNVPITLRRKK